MNVRGGAERDKRALRPQSTCRQLRDRVENLAVSCEV